MRHVMSANTWARVFYNVSSISTRSLSRQAQNAIAFNNFKHELVGAWSYEHAREAFNLPTVTKFSCHDYFGLMAYRNDRTAIKSIGPQGAINYSFDQLLKCSAQVANFFGSLGLKNSDRVMCKLPSNHVTTKICTLAATQRALVMVFSSAASTAQQIASCIKDNNIKVVVTTQSALPNFDGLTGILFVLTDGVPSNRPDCVDYNEYLKFPESYTLSHTNASEDPLFILYNEQQQRVSYSHYRWAIASVVMTHWLGLQRNDIMAHCPPHDEIMSLQLAFSSWNVGATLLTFEQLHLPVSTVLGALDCHRATHLYASSTQWRLLKAAEDKQKLPHLKQAVSAGEPLHPDVNAVFGGVSIREGYFYFGSLLAGVFQGRPVGTVDPAPGNKLQIVDGTGKQVVKGEGELAVIHNHQSGQTLPTDVKSPKDIKIFSRTGYIATCDNGESPIRIFGHRTNLFRQGYGRLIVLPTLEGELLKVADVSEVALVPGLFSGPGNENKLIACIVLIAGSNLTSLYIGKQVNKKLAGSTHEVAEVILCNKLPKTSTGEIDRTALKRELLERDNIAGLTGTGCHSPAL